jgi:AraC-like DNA-binding protein
MKNLLFFAIRGKIQRRFFMYDQTLLYEKGYSITINQPSAPLYFFFDYDTRVYNVNMDFQHFHRFYEIFVLIDDIDDKVGHIIEGDYYPLNQYDIVLLRPMLLHKTDYPAGPPIRRLIIDFAIPQGNSSLDGMIRPVLSMFDADLPIFRFSPEHRSRVFEILNDIFRLKTQYPATTDLLVYSKFIELLCCLYECRNHNFYVQENTQDFMTKKIYSLTSYIHAHFAEELSLEILSKRFFNSPFYLSRQFRRVTGFTLVNYIQMTRIRNAQHYLLDTDMKISEITERCGFTSFSHFNRVFHKFCKSSPSRFRSEGRREGLPAK